MSPCGQTQLRGLCPVCRAGVRVLLPVGGTAGLSLATAVTQCLCCPPGGYDESDVTFTWLRGNDSVRGIEKLRLSQYTVERYHTLLSKSQQETGKSGREKKQGKLLGVPHPISFPPVGWDGLTQS